YPTRRRCPVADCSRQCSTGRPPAHSNHHPAETGSAVGPTAERTDEAVVHDYRRHCRCAEYESPSQKQTATLDQPPELPAHTRSASRPPWCHRSVASSTPEQLHACP